MDYAATISAAWAFLNSNFSAALFGAFAGAWTAHHIAMRSERQKRLRDEILGVNAAIVLATNISNTFISMKRQHVLGMSKLYRRSFDEFVATHINPPNVPTEHVVITDYRALAMPVTTIGELRSTLAERVASCGSAMNIVAHLNQSIDGLSKVLAGRESTFALLRQKNEADRIKTYFGLPDSNGNIDERYPNEMTAIQGYVDDGIYFPMLLCEVLAAHGKKLAQAYGRRAPKVSNIEYQPFPEGILPDPAGYPDFENQYRSAPSNNRRSGSRVMVKL